MLTKLNTSHQEDIQFNKLDFNFNNYATTHLALDQFRQAMQAVGIHYTGELIADGKLQRIHIEGHKRGSKNGAYILHLDNHPAGWLCDFTTGLSQNWSSSGRERLRYSDRKQIKEAQRQREAERRQLNEEAAKKANFIWSQSKTITRRENHKYLITKGIQQHNARINRNSLVIPIYNESDQLVNLQFITPEGQKRFLKDGRKRGCFHIFGDQSEKILICEGFATGASVYEQSGQRVIVAFDASNLLPVAKNIRELAPETEIILCGDNDLSGIGQNKAKEAALAIGGKILIPKTPGTDWNDYMNGVRQHG